MKIDMATLKVLIPSSRMRMYPSQATNLVRRFYCGPMNVHSLCPAMCVNCEARLSNAFRLEGANKPLALLTYNLKVSVAKAKEEVSEARPKPKPDMSLFPVSENPFERIAREATSPSR